ESTDLFITVNGVNVRCNMKLFNIVGTEQFFATQDEAFACSQHGICYDYYFAIQIGRVFVFLVDFKLTAFFCVSKSSDKSTICLVKYIQKSLMKRKPSPYDGN